MPQPQTNDMSSEQKSWLAYTIAGAICADGSVDASEQIYLKEAISFLENQDQINELVEQVKKKKISPPRPIDMEKKQAFEILKHIAGLLIVDGRLSDSERNFLKTTGFALHFPEKVIETILNIAYEHLDSKRPLAQTVLMNNTFDIRISDLSEESCSFRLNKPVVPHTRVVFDFNPPGVKEKKYRTIVGQVLRSKNSKHDSSYIISIEFREKVMDDHGILQILYPERYKEKEGKDKKLVSSNNSLSGKFVSCFICEQNGIPFWSLRTKSMASQLNTMGVLTYTNPLPGKDFCDYNIIQVTVCPQCHFASNDILFFNSDENPVCPFDLKTFKETWKNPPKNSDNNNLEEFEISKRSHEKAIQTYQLAIKTHQTISNANPNHVTIRKVVSLLMIQAELYMNGGQRKEAEENLKRVVQKLEPIFEELDTVPIFRAAMLLFFIYLYMKNEEGVGKYLTFLEKYDRKATFDPHSEEARTLKLTLNLTSKAFQMRDLYGHDKLKTFHLET